MAEAEKRCESGDAAGCQALARLLEEPCFRGEASQCARLAKLYIGGRTGRIDKVKAVAAYERGCDHGDAEACQQAGLAYVRKDRAKSDTYHDKACQLGNADGCLHAAGAAREHEDAASQTKAESLAHRAEELFGKRCTAGDATGCYGLGNTVRRDDESKAQQYYAQATQIWSRKCDAGDDDACYHLGLAYEEESGVPMDEERARQLFEKPCAKGHYASCAELAQMARGSDDKSDDARAAPYFERACNVGLETRMPCREAGFMYADGEGVPVDERRAAVLLENGCNLGDDWCCFKLGTMLIEGDGIPQDVARGNELTQAANGLEFRVVEVKRGKKMVDPSLTAFGIPPSSLTPTTAEAGREFVRVALEVRRTTDSARLPVRKLYLVDASGKRFENHAMGDSPFGEKPLERREYLFQVPVDMRPVAVKFELGAITVPIGES
jgi:TPR repeat protein